MCRRFFPAIIIIIAIIMAFAASIAKPESVDYIVMTSRFFDIMLPVLAVGSLIKYLCCAREKRCKCACKNCNQCESKD